MNGGIKRGVSLYSFQEEMFLGQMTVEDCIAFASSIGATGVEILPEQNMPSFPNIDDREVAWWREVTAKHGTELTCYDMFLDTKLRKGQLISDEEQVASIRRDLTLCNRLGIRNMRVLVFVRPDILERCVPYAEDLDVHMGVEVHAPWHIEHAWILRTVDVADRLGTKHLGLLPDMGIFMKHYPPEFRDRFLRQGATPEIADFIIEQHEQKIMAEYTIYEVAVKMKGNKADIAMAETLRHAPYSNPKRLKDYIPYFRHIQAKFYGMTDDCTDPAIAYDDVIRELIAGGWTGYLSSEYEGNRWIQDVQAVDSREQVRRQHAMFDRIIGETEAQRRGTERRVMFRRCLIAALLISCPVASRAEQGPPTFEMKPMPAARQKGEIALNTGSARRLGGEEWFLQNGEVTVRNVTEATLTPVLPTGRSTGAAVIVAPGGGFLSLSMDTEGWQVARWLADHGVAAFVLKYRLAQTPAALSTYAGEFNKLVRGQPSSLPRPADTPDNSLTDAKAALRLARARSAEFGIDPKRVGFMGFSAGGMLARTVGILGAEDKPAFIAPIYPRMNAVAVPQDAPPMFVVLAGDDPLFGNESFDLIESWRAAKRPVEFHFVETGGHGFGLGKPGTTAEGWAENFYRWLGNHNFLKGE